MSIATTISLADAQAVLYRECDLLDADDFDAWLALYTDDAIYHIPGDDPAADPRAASSICYDDRARMGERVLRLKSGTAYAQVPPSRTVRFYANVQLAGTDPDTGETIVRSRLIIEEARLSKRRTVAARCEHRLRTEGDALKIARKTLLLVDAPFPYNNLTFIL
jgi:3-phenylpropionate/cinnamic acid dioxygenase small subunit